MEVNREKAAITTNGGHSTSNNNHNHNLGSTDALIINSNSNVVSEEIVLQLQEQFGDSKQIYIINTSSAATTATAAGGSQNHAAAAASATAAAASNGSIQYLIVDKDVDINLLLQDPNIFQAAMANNSPTSQNVTSNVNNNVGAATHNSISQHAATQAVAAASPSVVYSTNSHSKSTGGLRNSSSHYQQQQQQQQPQHHTQFNYQIAAQNPIINDAEESIVRVQEPPPKRKRIDYRPLDSTSGKPSTYQEAFIRYLAACGDETPQTSGADSTNSTVRKHPRDKIYQNFFINSSLAVVNKTPPVPTTTTTTTTTITTSATTTMPAVTTTNSSFQSIPSQLTSTQMNGGGPTTSSMNSTTMMITSPTTTTTATTHLDKENYYNSSRRENLTPLNSCEYRNSYKDVYDNQGVRVNPAIIKSLQAAAAAASSTSSFNNTTVAAAVNVPLIASSSSSMSMSKNVNPSSQVGSVRMEDGGVGVVSSNILSDHTYRTSSSQTKAKSDSPKIVTNESSYENDSKIDSPHSTPLGEHVVANSNSKTSGSKVNSSESKDLLIHNVTFSPGEFLIHKPSFSGDFNSYDIWCVLDDCYLQKYEPVQLLSGERCHQSVELLAQYTANKEDFLLVKVEEKGKTETDNLVVAVLAEFEPKNNLKMANALSGSSQITTTDDSASATTNAAADFPL